MIHGGLLDSNLRSIGWGCLGEWENAGGSMGEPLQVVGGRGFLDKGKESEIGII